MEKKIIAVFFSILIVISIFADIGIGYGSVTDMGIPVEPYFNYSYSEVIYLASEIGAADTITTLSWHFSGTSLSNSNNWTIYMGHTSKASFSSSSDWVTSNYMTQVWSGTFPDPGTSGWITFDITDFVYNGTDNLVIGVDENSSGSNTNYDDFLCSNVVNDRCMMVKNTNTNPDPASPPQSNYTSSVIANIILGGISQPINTFPWSEDFSTWPPSDWDLHLVSGHYWEHYTQNNTSCATFHPVSGGTGLPVRLTTPFLDISGLTYPTLTFDWSHKDVNDGIILEVIVIDSLLGDDAIWVKTGPDFDSGDGGTATSPGSFTGSGTISLLNHSNNIKIEFSSNLEENLLSDIFIDNVKVYDSPTPTQPIYFSEICDNLPGANQNTGFVEIYNQDNLPIDLSNYFLNMGDENIFGDFSFMFQSATIAPQSYFVISNGANLNDFNFAWNKNLTSSEFLQGTDSLTITSGKAYSLNSVFKSIIDITPAIGDSKRRTQESNGSWSNEEDSSNGTPGGNDAPLAVTLASFNATFSNNELTILWSTYSEQNNVGWNVYRSDDEMFDNATRVNSSLINGNGTTTEISQYKFYDETSHETGITYWYWIQSVNYNGVTTLFCPVSLDIPNNEPSPPSTFITGLQQNYPNPFNPETRIDFNVIQNKNAVMTIYNVKGEKVKTLFNGISQGNNSVLWDGKNDNGTVVPSGIYFYKLITEDKVFTKKMILLK